MAESEEELSLKLTDDDKQLLKEMVKQHLGVDCTREKSIRNSGNNASDLQPNENDLESLIKSIKKAIIEEVCSEFLNNYFHKIDSSTKVLSNQYLSTDTLRSRKNLQQDKDSTTVRAEDVSKTTAEMKSGMLISSPVSSKDFTRGEQVKDFPDILEDTGLEKDIETNKITNFYKSNQLNSIETSSDDPKVDLITNNNNYEENLEKGEEICKSKHRDMSLQQSAFKNVFWGPSKDVENLRFPLKSKILSLYQSKLTKNQISPVYCLNLLCFKSLWPNPIFSLVEQHFKRGFIFDVSIKGKVFAEGKTWARSKKIAKQLASAACLERFGFECPLAVFGPHQAKNNNGVTSMDREHDSQNDNKDREARNNSCGTMKDIKGDSQNVNFGGTRYNNGITSVDRNKEVKRDKYRGTKYNSNGLNVDKKREIPNDKDRGQYNKERTGEHRQNTSTVRPYNDLRVKLNMNKRKATQKKLAEENHSVKRCKLS